MRLSPMLFIFFCLGLGAWAEDSSLASKSATSEPAWPLWNGRETAAEYGLRAGLEATQTLELGHGVKLELALIPAGKFVMGTPEPESPWIGGSVLGCAGLAALGLLSLALVRAVRKRRRPQFSLRWLIVL